MTYVVLAFDGDDQSAPELRAALRDSHIAYITEEAAAGRLLLELPLQGEDGKSHGSLMLLDGDAEDRDAYFAEEPFVAGMVWQRIVSHPFRIAALPYAPWPTASSLPEGRTHTVILAMDGTDPGAPHRRLAVRARHFERVRSMASDGTLLVGGAILDAQDGGMIGSIAVTRHTSDTACHAWMAEDPYVTGDVWRDITLYGTRLRVLPYPPLPFE